MSLPTTSTPIAVNTRNNSEIESDIICDNDLTQEAENNVVISLRNSKKTPSEDIIDSDRGSRLCIPFWHHIIFKKNQLDCKYRIKKTPHELQQSATSNLNYIPSTSKTSRTPVATTIIAPSKTRKFATMKTTMSSRLVALTDFIRNNNFKRKPLVSEDGNFSKLLIILYYS